MTDTNIGTHVEEHWAELQSDGEVWTGGAKSREELIDQMQYSRDLLARMNAANAKVGIPTEECPPYGPTIRRTITTTITITTATDEPNPLAQEATT